MTYISFPILSTVKQMYQVTYIHYGIIANIMNLSTSKYHNVEQRIVIW